MLLTEEEIKGFKSMSLYWQEVRRRDDKRPLQDEVHQVVDILGVRILALIEEYIK